MKIFSLLLAVLILLTGCAQDLPEALPPETMPSPTETALPETEAPETEPADPLEVLLSRMPLEHKVGQLFLARHPEENAPEDVKQFHLGGYILFARDLQDQDRESLLSMLSQYQLASSIPMLIAVDEEGGTVCRVSGNPAFRAQSFPSPRSLYAEGGMDAVLAAEAEKAQLLQELAINVNMAPVCDIATESTAFMYRRSLGQSPETTGQFARSTCAILESHQVGSVVKHFPGYGNNSDTHTAMAVDNRSLEELESADLIPFQMAIDGGCGAIMVSHTIVEALDPDNPATLSPAVHDYLRQTMGFAGVIVTDDLAMGAITETYGAEEAAVLAVLAGNDLLCSTDYAAQYRAVLEAVTDGRIPEETLNAAVLRLLRWKQRIGLLY